MKDLKKIKLGQYFTKSNPFLNDVFEKWFKGALTASSNNKILEPFVGNEDIINLLKVKYKFEYTGFDIQSQNKKTRQRDTIKSYPQGYNIAITNPPYLARNSATRKGIPWSHDGFDDLYKVALDKMLNNNGYVAAIIPATFITRGITRELFRNRLTDYILLNFKMFQETDTPVCLALFQPPTQPNYSDDFEIWELKNEYDINSIGTYVAIKNQVDDILKQNKHSCRKIRFNDVKGKHGVLATDRSLGTIKFVDGDKIPNDKVKSTSRNMVRFSINGYVSLYNLNQKLKTFYNANGEVLLATFKSLWKDGKYRRRLDFNTIKRMVQAC